MKDLEAGRPVSEYRLLEEVGRGGMGVVWRAYDVRLGREVAIKFLRSERSGDPAAVERFVTESRITGRLQHPGIPAVHEPDMLPDGRPFLAMKLVRGRTLHNLLTEYYRRSDALPRGEEGCGPSPARKQDGAEDQPFLSSCGRRAGDVERIAAARGRFLAIFEQVCHAVGYAHAHKVIHRDLKPSNVMVGEFGEVQVMDWGLAKVLLPSRDPQEAAFALADEPRSHDKTRFPDDYPEAGETCGEAASADSELTMTLDAAGNRSGRSESATQRGSVLGTPAYMAPEQAAGEIHRLDARSDVFGLGAILCQILTGQPPYRSKPGHDVLQLAAQGELGEAFAALDACGAEPELVALCKGCLAVRRLARWLVMAGMSLLQGEQFAAAEEVLRQSLAIQEEKEPEDWTTFGTMSLLGAALLAQKKYAEAEPLLLGAYEGLLTRLQTIPPDIRNERLLQTLDRLIALYTAMEKPEEAAKWQAEKAKLLP